VNIYGDKMTGEITFSKNEENAKLEWEQFVKNNNNKFRDFLDFGRKCVEKAILIRSHYDEAQIFSVFVWTSIACLGEIAKKAGEDGYAQQMEKMYKEEKMYEETPFKEPQRDNNPWTKKQALKEWRNFVKENTNKFKEFIKFLREISKQAESIYKKYGVNLYSAFADAMFVYATTVESYYALSNTSRFQHYLQRFQVK